MTMTIKNIPSDNNPELKPKEIKKFGWRKDSLDNRDKKWKSPRRMREHFPRKVDLRQTGFLPTPVDQDELGSCTGNAIATAYQYEQRKQGLPDFQPSRLFIYYGERELEGTINSDAGAEIRDGMKVINKLGVPNEKYHQYDINKFRERPSQEAYYEALTHQTINYATVDVTITAVKTALMAQTPVVIGFTFYPWFDNPSKGVILPKKASSPDGGHCVLIVGYETLRNTRTVYAIVQNSWGEDWGDKGYCYFPLKWLCDKNNADDFWAIQSVEG